MFVLSLETIDFDKYINQTKSDRVPMECTEEGQLLSKDAEISSFLPSSLSRPEDQTSQTFNSSIQENELELHDEPLNEFNTPTSAFLAFACLFPDTKAYPTSRAIFKDIFASDTD